MIDPRDRIILPLDMSGGAFKAIEMIERLEGLISFYKVGYHLFLQEGPRIITTIKDKGVRVFLDLKFHDIPNTVADASRMTVSFGVDMFNLHIGGGDDMMRAAVEAAEDQADRIGVHPPIILGVTLLTSIDQNGFQEIYGSNRNCEQQVLLMAKRAKDAGLSGVVASAAEARAISRELGDDFVIVTPGVRPAWASRGDQKRVMTPSAAIAAGAHYLVIGRPIWASDDPVTAASRIIEELES